MSLFKNKYRIESVRLQSWNYSWNGAYFITICTHNKGCYFGNIRDHKMNLTSVGVIADVFWHEINHHSDRVELGDFVVMPNHIHGILILKTPMVHDGISDNGDSHYDNGLNSVKTRHALSLQPSPQLPGQKRFRNPEKKSISSIIGSYKSAVTKHAHRLGYDFRWQPRFHDHIIRDEHELHMISEYIRTNQLKWEYDCHNPKKSKS